MQVDLIASTVLSAGHAFGELAVEPWMTPDVNAKDGDTLAEFAGRACYQSFDKPNPKTSTNSGYLWNILQQGHESVLEHASASFYVTGVSRALTHELIRHRHRHLSFSELSQRFVNVEDAEVVVPPAIRESIGQGKAASGLREVSNVGDYTVLAEGLQERGYTRKQAREAARAVLTNATETRIVVTGNMRAWRDVLKKRWSVHADAEIRDFAGEVLSHLRRVAPNTVKDIPEKPFGEN